MFVKFSLEKIISSDRSTVFDVFSDYANYSSILFEHFPFIRVRSIRDNIAIVEEHINLGSEKIIMAKHILQRPNTHEIYIIGGDLKGSYICERFTESENTKVTIECSIKIRVSDIFYRDRYIKYFDKIYTDLAKII